MGDARARQSDSAILSKKGIAAVGAPHRLEIVHGGPDYDARYPEGIPTRVEIDHAALGRLDGGLVLFPQGHARSDAARTAALVDLKFDRLVAGAVDDPAALRTRMQLAGRTAAEIADLYAFPIRGCQPA